VQPLSTFLVPGLEPADPLAFISVAIALALVSLLATLSPARRALGLGPLRALREE
jgi:ABC-type lipoprotein release transport system permease subunit